MKGVALAQQTIWAKAHKKMILYPLPEGSGNGNPKHSEFIAKENQSLFWIFLQNDLRN